MADFYNVQRLLPIIMPILVIKVSVEFRHAVYLYWCKINFWFRSQTPQHNLCEVRKWRVIATIYVFFFQIGGCPKRTFIADRCDGFSTVVVMFFNDFLFLDNYSFLSCFLSSFVAFLLALPSILQAMLVFDQRSAGWLRWQMPRQP